MTPKYVDPSSQIPRWSIWYLIFLTISMAMTGILYYQLLEIIPNGIFTLTTIQFAVMNGVIIGAITVLVIRAKWKQYERAKQNECIKQ